jgi:hypothetical protein
MVKINKKLAKWKRLQNKTANEITLSDYDYIEEYIGQGDVISDELYLLASKKLLSELTKKELLDLENSDVYDVIQWMIDQSWGYDVADDGKLIPKKNRIVEDFDIFNYIKPSFKKNKEVVLNLIKQGYGTMEHIDTSLKKNKEFILNLISPLPENIYPTEFHNEFKYVDLSLKSDKDFALKALKITGEIFPYLSSDLQKDRKIVLSAFNSNVSCYFFKARPYLNQSILNDKDIIFLAEKKNRFGNNDLKYLKKEFKENKEIVMAIVESSPLNLKYASNTLKKDRDICLAATQYSLDAISFIDKSLKKDMDVAFHLIKIHFDAFKYIDKSLLSNLKFAKKVINYDGTLIEKFSEKIRKNKEIVIKAVSNNWRSLNNIHKSFLKSEGVIMAAIKNNGASMILADQSIKKNKSFCLKAIKIDPEIYDDIDSSLQDDPEILKATGKNKP